MGSIQGYVEGFNMGKRLCIEKIEVFKINDDDDWFFSSSYYRMLIYNLIIVIVVCNIIVSTDYVHFIFILSSFYCSFYLHFIHLYFIFYLGLSVFKKTSSK